MRPVSYYKGQKPVYSVTEPGVHIVRIRDCFKGDTFHHLLNHWSLLLHDDHGFFPRLGDYCDIFLQDPGKKYSAVLQRS